MKNIKYLLTVMLLGGLGYSVFGGPRTSAPKNPVPQGLCPTVCYSAISN